MKSFQKIAYYLAAIIVLPLLVGAVGMTILRLDGRHVVSVQTASMEPTFSPGDALIVEHTDFNSLQVGDIITYTSTKGDHQITHRIVAINNRLGQITTAGDKRHSPDPSISTSQVVGRATTILPQLGRITDWLHRPIGILVAVYLPATIIIVMEIVRLAHHFAHPSYLLDYTYATKRGKT